MKLDRSFTSTGEKFFCHEEAMRKLRNGKGQPIVTHVMLTDVCQHTCAFCSVQARAGDSLDFQDVMDYLAILQGYGLKAVILSGGGNPILYKCKRTGKDFNDVVDAVHARGLQIGLITNGMKMQNYAGDMPARPIVTSVKPGEDGPSFVFRESWLTVKPSTLDKLTWIRISMAGLDHEEECVYVPDVDQTRTTLGFSYVGHDIYTEPADPHHGKVSARADLLSGDRAPDRPFESRILKLTTQIGAYASEYKPRYVRLLPNCLEPELIAGRCKQLQRMADAINAALGHEVVFVQHKPPSSPDACYLGYIHPVLNCDGYVFPCDSCVLNQTAEHKFAEPWRICHWKDIAKLYEEPVHTLIRDPHQQCPGCVFPESNRQLIGVVDGTVDITPPSQVPEHANFV